MNEKKDGSSYKNIIYDTNGPVGVITLNRPEKRNALSFALLHELDNLFECIREDTAIKVVVIKGAGPAFSSGHDLAEVSAMDPVAGRDLFQICSQVMLKIQEMPQPFIAQVHGVATAAGCQLVATCDLAVAEEGARFGTPGVNIGLFCTTPAIPLVRNIGRKRALEMLFAGRLLSAAEAEQYGLVNTVVPLPQLEAETNRLAARIAEASRMTLAIGKHAFYRQVVMADDHAYVLGSEVMADNLGIHDAAEGITAFLEKRKPVWQDQ